MSAQDLQSSDSSDQSKPVLVVGGVSKSFGNGTKKGEIKALDEVSFTVREGELIALVGPDGAGKTTMLRLIAGLLAPDAGELILFGNRSVGGESFNLGYMPQKFGLYEDLTVLENMDLYADLRGLKKEDRKARYAELLGMTGMEQFGRRLAGKLSGGMKQKLGLICTLIRPPRLLLLDEPTVGVDPLSRRELWHIIEILASGSGMSVVVSTSYLDEASRCGEVVLLHEGHTLATGAPETIRSMTEGMSYLARPAGGDSPRALQARLLTASGMIDSVPQGGRVRFVHGELTDEQETGMKRFLRGAHVESVPSSLEDSFMLLLKRHLTGEGEGRASADDLTIRTHVSVSADWKAGEGNDREPVIETSNVYRCFGDFIAVNNVSFTVYRGEVFGLLGPNGAGKTTTFRMLCGLLAASSGHLKVAGVDVREARREARRRIGYVAQKFSLYASLSVRENLDFFSGAYGLRGARKDERIKAMVHDFSLGDCLDTASGELPGGYKRRLAMGVGLLHEPLILFLDEPTSGADPLARREFWQRITVLAEKGVTVVVTTHFMEEAEYCDRILIQSDGVMLALDTPANIRTRAGDSSTTTMEDAFIAIVEEGRERKGGGSV